nr:hypothetical protein [Tanacetum cinerariifolium]
KKYVNYQNKDMIFRGTDIVAQDEIEEHICKSDKHTTKHTAGQEANKGVFVNEYMVETVKRGKHIFEHNLTDFEVASEEADLVKSGLK